MRKINISHLLFIGILFIVLINLILHSQKEEKRFMENVFEHTEYVKDNLDILNKAEAQEILSNLNKFKDLLKIYNKKGEIDIEKEFQFIKNRNEKIIEKAKSNAPMVERFFIV